MVEENVEISVGVIEEILDKAAVKQVAVNIQLLVSVDHVLVLDWIFGVANVSTLTVRWQRALLCSGTTVCFFYFLNRGGGVTRGVRTGVSRS